MSDDASDRRDRAIGPPVALGDVVDLTIDKLVAGGDGLARHASGRVVFVTGVLPGEQVTAEITEVRKDLARAAIVSIASPSSRRVAPPCPSIELGCGGCDWQHIDAAHQLEQKVAIVRDGLARLARLPDAPVRAGLDTVDPSISRGRTTVRLGVYGDGRPAYRRRRSNHLIAVNDCMVLHPALEDLLGKVRAPGATEVIMRVADATGERAVSIVGRSRKGAMPTDALVGDDAVVHERVAGATLSVSMGSFFQSSRHAAELLVAAVRGPLTEAMPERIVDAYGGAGLFTAALASDVPGARWTLIESNASATADARRNLAGTGVKIITGDVAKWRVDPADVIIADPARPGLGRSAASTLVASGAGRIILVSCDAASMARDTALLMEHGYVLNDAQVLPVFPHTSHVEIVSTFTR
ncbi:MAG: class I SAM-dependent RNA methyltransferase [Acidimicrobiia bacterium]